MLSDQALEAVYTDEQTGPGPKIKPQPATAPAADPGLGPRTDADIIGGATTNNSPVTGGAADPINVQEYGKYLDQGVYSNQDIDSQRGQKQSFLNKVGHAALNIPGNIIGDLIEGIGDMGLLATQWGDNRNYENALTDAGKQLHNLSGDLYDRGSHDTFGATISDPTWWVNQVSGAVEYGVSYAALGAGIGEIVGGVAKGTASLLRTGATTTRALAAAGQLGSAGLMSYTMGAQSAGNVFQKTYDTQFNNFINQGLSPEDASDKAKHIAAQSAATTAQLTTAIGTVLGLTGMAPYFSRSEDVVQGILKKKIPQLAEETNEAWLQRVKSLDPDTFKTLINPTHSIGRKLAESGKMGVEMMQLGFGEKTGDELGQKGKVKSFTDQFGELEHFFDRTMDKDGATAFLIGAAIGAGTDYLRHNVIPSGRHDRLDPETGQPLTHDDGTIQKAWLTPRAYSEMYTRPRFNSVRDTVASDIESYDRMQKSYLAAVTSKDPVAIEKAENIMFNVNNLNAITTGMGDVWRKTYEDISNYTPEQAEAKGYASNYKEKATEATSMMDRQQKMYDDLQKRYGVNYAGNEGLRPVVDGIFARKAHLDMMDKVLSEHEEKIKLLTKDSDANLAIADPELYSEHTADYFRKWNSGTDAAEKIKGDHKLLTSLSAQYDKGLAAGVVDEKIDKRIRAIAGEYSAIDPEMDSSSKGLSKAAHGTLEQMQKQIDIHQKNVTEAEQLMFASSGFNKWKENNPDAKFEDYLSKVAKNVENTQYASQIERERSLHAVATRNLGEILKEKSLTRFSKKAQEYFERERTKDEELSRNSENEITARAKDLSAKDHIQRENKNIAARKLEIERQAAQEKLETMKTAGNADLVEKAKLEARVKELGRRQEEHTYTTEDTSPKTVEDVMTNHAEVPNEPLPGHDEVEGFKFYNEELQPMIEDTVEVERIAAETVQEKIDEKNRLADVVLSHALQHPTIPDLYDRLMEIQKGWMDPTSGIGFSYDMLNNQTKSGKLTTDQAARILTDLRDYTEAVQALQGDKDFIEYQQHTPDEVPDLGYDIIGEDRPVDIPVEQNQRAELLRPVPRQGISFAGSKTVDALSIANSTLGYYEFNPNKNQEIEMSSIKDAINEKTSLLVLKPGGLQKGTDLHFVVDVDYDGAKNLAGEFKQDEFGKVPMGKESFQDFVDDRGKVPADKMGNVPIKIVDAKSGQAVGYVRKHDWVKETYPLSGGKTGLRNIAEKFDEAGNEINGAAQSRRILDARKAIVDQFNANRGLLTGKVSYKGPGHVILNTENKVSTTNEKSKTVAGYAFNRKNGGLLPDPKIRITVFNNGTFFTGKDYPFKFPVSGDTTDIYNGGIFTMLPGANGEHHPVPLVGKSLGDSPLAVDTVLRAITLYLKHTGATGSPVTEEVSKLLANTTHDVSRADGLNNFINQYFTHTANFQDSATIPDLRPDEFGRKKHSQFMFQVKDAIKGKEVKGTIKIGTSYSGKNPVTATIDPKTGELNQVFQDTMRNGLGTRSRAVVFSRTGIRGINEAADEPFKDAIFNTKTGKWTHPSYDDYNQYVKSFSQTTAYGRNKLSDGSYTYVANPSIEYRIDTPKDLGSTSLVHSNDTSTSVKLSEPRSQESEVNDLMADLGLGMRASKPIKVDEIGTPGENSRPLNIRNLEDLYNFTPEEQRNGKTPSEVLKTLMDRGHTGLSDGYNPFSLCL